jgi:hypothetical protein
MLVNNHRSGRTTQIRENCFKFASEGETVFFVFPTREMAKYSFNELEAEGFDKIVNQMVFRYKQGSVRYIGANEFYNHTIGRNDYRIFFDHTVSEMDGVKIAR